MSHRVTVWSRLAVASGEGVTVGTEHDPGDGRGVGGEFAAVALVRGHTDQGAARLDRRAMRKASTLNNMAVPGRESTSVSASAASWRETAT